MERRDALRVLGAGLVGLAGCAGRVPDSLDSGGEGTTPAAERQFSHFESYDDQTVTVALAKDDVPPDLDARFRLLVRAQEYPRGDVLTTGRSAAIEGFDDAVRTVDVTLDGPPESTEPMHYVASVVADGSAGDDVGSIVAETDRFTLDGGSLVAAPHPEAVGEFQRGSFTRTVAEGAYHLSLGGADSQVELSLRVFKSEFVLGRIGYRGHDYPPYVDQATDSGLAGRIATDTYAAAIDRDREPVEFAIDAVQTLPYVPESVTADADEYIKYPAETLVDGGGDCEDSAILLASVLQASPYAQDCALIHPPYHMGLGIAGDEYGGTFYPYQGARYFYVETTGSGWEIGQLPEEYANTSALVFQV